METSHYSKFLVCFLGSSWRWARNPWVVPAARFSFFWLLSSKEAKGDHELWSSTPTQPPDCMFRAVTSHCFGFLVCKRRRIKLVSEGSGHPWSSWKRQDAKVYVTSASPLPWSSQEESVFQLLCSQTVKLQNWRKQSKVTHKRKWRGSRRAF